MESPVRKMQKRNDYNRHKLFRKIKRRRKAQAEQQSKAAEKELKKRLKWTAPKFEDGKNIKNSNVYEYPTIVQELQNTLVNSNYNKYLMEGALKDVVNKTISYYPSPYKPPSVYYDVNKDIYDSFYSNPEYVVLGTKPRFDNTYYNYSGNPLRTAAHEVAHHYDNITNGELKTEEDINPNMFQRPDYIWYHSDNRLDRKYADEYAKSALEHDAHPDERYADRIASYIVPGYGRYENTRPPKFDYGKDRYIQEIDIQNQKKIFMIPNNIKV